MGCSCRGGSRISSRSLVVSPAQKVVVSSPTRSLCSSLESEGDNTTVRIGVDGRLYLNAPFSTNMPASSALSSTGCRGPFSQAVLAATIKLSGIYLSQALKARFQVSLPSSSVKLGLLREVLRSF
jgi:hypothetical protein